MSSHEDSWWLRWGLFLLPVIFSAWAILLKVGAPEAYASLAAEDRGLEIVQFLFFLTGGILFLLAALTARPDWGVVRWAWLLSGLVLIFVAGEEISWGQRLLGFETPRFIITRNSQRELSLHNLRTLQGYLHPAYILLGVSGGFGWLLFGWAARRFRRLGWIIPPWFLSSYFWPVAVVYSLLEAKAAQFRPGMEGNATASAGLLQNVVSRDQEWAELMLAVVCALIALRVTRLARRFPK